MKTERRHELQTNQLAKWTIRWLDRIKPYTTAILAGVLGAAVLYALYAYLTHNSSARQATAWQRYMGARVTDRTGAVDPAGLSDLQEVADEFPGSRAGDWARLALADAQRDQGADELFKDKAAASQSLNSAVENYELVQSSAPHESSIGLWATMGLGQAHEFRSDLTKAKKAYQQVIDSWPNTPGARRAEARLAQLSRKSTQRFYDWFKKEEPAPVPDLGGLSGLDFNDNSLLNEPSPFGAGLESGQSASGETSTGEKKAPTPATGSGQPADGDLKEAPGPTDSGAGPSGEDSGTPSRDSGTPSREPSKSSVPAEAPAGGSTDGAADDAGDAKDQPAAGEPAPE